MILRLLDMPLGRMNWVRLAGRIFFSGPRWDRLGLRRCSWKDSFIGPFHKVSQEQDDTSSWENLNSSWAQQNWAEKTRMGDGVWCKWKIWPQNMTRNFENHPALEPATSRCWCISIAAAFHGRVWRQTPRRSGLDYLMIWDTDGTALPWVDEWWDWTRMDVWWTDDLWWSLIMFHWPY
jgi:hypothetical protein